METINKQRLTIRALEELSDKLLSYRQTSLKNGVLTKTNLIVGIEIPDSQDFIKILFLDRTSTVVWLDNGRLPEIKYQADAKPNLPVISLSRFTENVLNTIIRAFYNVDA